MNAQSKNIKIMARLKKTTTKSAQAVRLVAIVVAVGSIVGATVVHADQYDEQINALRNQNVSIQGQLNGLTSQASSYQQTISQLQAQIYGVQAQIAANEQQQATVNQEITDKQNQIAQKKQQLAATIKALYLDGQTSTIETLATSKNLSDYVDKEEYRQKVQTDLDASIKQLNELQRQLQIQKGQLDTLVASQKTQESQLASTQAQQAQLLAYNQQQQSSFNSQINANVSQIAELRRQQIIANSKYNIGDFKGDPNNGGYPSVWAHAPQDSMVDSWGMYNRECVSYTAFRVHQDYLAGKNSHDMPWWGGVGNANQWDDNARAMGLKVDSNPTPGSIAISNAGFYGHAMYVEAVNGNEIYVQQYNQQLTGQYSEGWRYTTGLVFIHF